MCRKLEPQTKLGFQIESGVDGKVQKRYSSPYTKWLLGIAARKFSKFNVDICV